MAKRNSNGKGQRPLFKIGDRVSFVFGNGTVTGKIADEKSQSWERKENVAAVFYGPLNYIEYDVFGLGMAHAGCSPFFRLVK
jgi:hypothetical protein